MKLYSSPREYLYNLETLTNQDAIRLWKRSIKEKWNFKCAYCGSDENLTIDHIIPQAKGGSDIITNVISCCQSCNQDKAHQNWEDWFHKQQFFTESKKNFIIEWMSNLQKQNLHQYHKKKNLTF